MQYNSDQYNGDEYNLTQFSNMLVESVGLSDDLTKFSMTVKTDSQASVDALSDGVSLSAFLDNVPTYQHAYTQLAYNNSRYNWNMYNIRYDDDEIVLMAIKALSDTMGPPSDVVITAAIKVLLETQASSDILFFAPDSSLSEFLFLSEAFRIEVANKAINDVLRVNDWLQIRKQPFVEYWHD